MATATATDHDVDLGGDTTPAMRFELRHVAPEIPDRMPLTERVNSPYRMPVNLVLTVVSQDLDALKQAEAEAEASERVALSAVEYDFLEHDERAARVRQLESTLQQAQDTLRATDETIRAAERLAWQAIDQGTDPAPHEQRAVEARHQAEVLRGRIANTETLLTGAKGDAHKALTAAMNAKRLELRRAAEAERDTLAARLTESFNADLLGLYLALMSAERLSGRLDGPTNPAVLLARGQLERGGFRGLASTGGRPG